MRIAIFSDVFYPELTGISDSIITLAKGLAQYGHEIRFYVPHYSVKDYRKVGLEPKELQLGPHISIRRLSALSFGASTGQGRTVITTGAAYRSLKKWKPDIIHTQLCFGTGLEALIAGKKLNVPVVGTNHTDMTEFMHYGPTRSKWFAKIILDYISWYYNRCRFVTAPSNFIFKGMIKHGFKKPHRALSNPVDIVSFHPPAPDEKISLKKQFGVTDKTVIFTGRLAAEKHVDVLIRAFAAAKKSVPDASMIITGFGPVEEALKKLSEELGLGKSIKFLGLVSPATLIQAYQASDIFTIASTAETQSLSMMNAMASGLPAIGVRAGALPEYINDQNGFVVEPGDYEAIAKKLVYLFNNPSVKELLGHNARTYVEQFSIPNIVKEWITLFMKVANISS